MASEKLIILNENKELETASTSTEEEQDVKNPILLTKNLSRLMKRLKGENMMDDSTINYTELINSEVYKVDYAQLSNQLKKVDLNLLLDEDEKKNDDNLKAFFINVYNALAIHGIAYLTATKDKELDMKGSLIEQMEGKFWAIMAYQIGKDGQVYSLDDIEHGILRANRPHPSKKGHHFHSSDVRKRLSVKHADSRIHFALNCGALSCPPISFYTLENLEKGLDLAAQNYITNETSIDTEKKSVEISKLLLWYREDFTGNIGQNEVINFAKKALQYSIITKGLPLKWMTSIKRDDQVLLEYVYKFIRESDEKKNQLKELCEGKDEIKITYKPYSFDINNKK